MFDLVQVVKQHNGKILRFSLNPALIALFSWSLLAALGCTTAAKEATWGVQPERASLVPARIAIIPCRPWPAASRFSALPLTSQKEADVNTLCAQYDTFVTEGFKAQPYMRGLSPKLITKVIETEKKPSLIEDGFKLWTSSLSSACMNCKTAAGYYSSSIAALPDWRKWLAEFGGVAKGADAILIPFFMYAYEDLLDDRGLIEKKRAAGVSLLLVETSTGALIWAGNQEAVATTKEFSTSSSAKELAFAPWERVMQRLLVNNIWRDFPGRQEQ